MSVYTRVPHYALGKFLLQYDIGCMTSFDGIREGIDNSNYFLSTTQGDYVLTVFETLNMEEVPLCMELMHYLSRHGVPCADPVASNSERYVMTLMGKPASIVVRLEGGSVNEAGLEHISAVGAAMARWHSATDEKLGIAGFASQREDRFGKKWCRRAAQLLIPQLSVDEQNLLKEEVRLHRFYTHSNLPQGIIHGDLFRDNALFVQGRLSGIIDLYDCCTGPFLYDIAVVVNDWCRDHRGELNIRKTEKLLASYHCVRRLNATERGAWPILLRAAALRFWLSRLQLRQNPQRADLPLKKDPMRYKNILQNCILEESLLTTLWVS